MKKIENRIGEKFTTNEGYTIEIVDYRNNKDCDVKFLDEYGYISKNRYFKDLLVGKVKNPYHPAVYGRGYIGEGEGGKGRVYNIWKKVLQRCYSKEYHIKKPTYIGCSVVEEWLNFQNFVQWYDENYNPETMEGWHLDKDILFKGNKIYSPETCCFVPADINSLLTKTNAKRGKYPIGVSVTGNKFSTQISNKRKGSTSYIGLFSTPEEAFKAYKKVKEQRIKEVADKWKYLINDEVYKALYNYEVDIHD